MFNISELNMFMQIAWWTAIITTLFFLIQTAMVFFGGDFDNDVDSDFDDSSFDDAQGDTGFSFQWFTFKNLITLLMFFSWGVIYSDEAGNSQTISILIGASLGLFMVFIMTLIFASVKKLNTNNVPTMDPLIGKAASVYLRIPSSGNGMGKITVTLHGGLKTIDAITTENVDIPTGSQVRVTGLSGTNVAIVELLK